jgi:hypothetical protein
MGFDCRSCFRLLCIVHFAVSAAAFIRLPFRIAMAISATRCTVRSESRCALRLRYVDLVASIEVAVEVCSCFTVFSFIRVQRLSERTVFTRRCGVNFPKDLET